MAVLFDLFLIRSAGLLGAQLPDSLGWALMPCPREIHRATLPVITRGIPRWRAEVPGLRPPTLRFSRSRKVLPLSSPTQIPQGRWRRAGRGAPRVPSKST
jgi:hypothetical protein